MSHRADHPREPRTPRRHGRRIAAGLAAAAVVAAGLAAAPVTQAVGIGDGTGTFTAANGTVGVPQVVTFSLGSGSIPSGPVTIVATGSASSQPVNAATVNMSGGSAQGTFAWTPPHAGTWTFCATAFTCTGSTFINQVGTTVAVTAANTVKLGQQTTISATVTAQSGSVLAPLGQVQFAIVGGGNYGPPVWLNGSNPSTASVAWTPGTLGTVSWTATYIPNVVNGVADTTCGNSCTSPVDTIQVTSTGTNMFLSNPGTLTAGATATLQAVVSVVPPTGSVSFTINGAPIASNVPVNAQGIAATSWVPPAPGNYTLAASWIGNGGQQATSSEVLTVVAAGPQADTIVVTAANGTVLNPATTFSLANGTSTALTTRTSSGAAATLSENGPCTLAGNTLTAIQGSGSCRVTATSPGGNGYSAGSSTFTVTLVPGTQAASTPTPVSGRISRGSTLVLEQASAQGTNAGQSINWRVTEGRNVCQLRFPSSGAVQLRAVRNGTCTIRGTAPAIAGQWNRLVINRTYRVR